MVVTLGVTTIPLPLTEPGIQVYEVAPLALRVVDPPEHRIEFEVTAITVGLGETFSVNTAVAVQPAAPVPVSV
jgi:hypothetical protein